MLDFGAGGLRDSKYLLSKGFHVTALDKEFHEDFPYSGLQFQRITSTFEEVYFPHDSFDVIIAHNSLPFIKKEDFERVWENLYKWLTPEGTLIVNFFGENHGWNGTMITHSIEEISQLLQKYTVQHLQEKDEDSETVSDGIVRWHSISVIAQKI